MPDLCERMPDLCTLVGPLAFVYGAVCLSVFAARLSLASFALRGRRPGAAEAAWCVFLPPLAVALLPVMVPVSYLPVSGWSETFHRAGHLWVEEVVSAPALHAALHAANVALLVYAAVRGFLSVRNAVAARNALQALRSVARDRAADVAGPLPVYLLPVAEPLCFTAGLRAPAAYLSRGLAARLNDEQVGVVLAHEGAHARRRDGATFFFLSTFYSLFHIPGAAPLLGAYRAAAERACDAEAARRCGDPRSVAETLVLVARLGMASGRPPSDALAFCPDSGDDLNGRVVALLEMVRGEPLLPVPRTPLRAWLMAGASAVAVLGMDYAIRHGVEAFVRH